MNFEEWARLTEELSTMTPTQKANRVKVIDFGKDFSIVFNTWAKTYNNIGVGESGLAKRLSETMGFELETFEDMYEMEGGLPEWFDAYGDATIRDSNISINDALSCLYVNDMEEAYELYFASFYRLSDLGRKWLTAYMLKQTRNGIGESEVKKMLVKYRGIKAAEIKRAACFLNISEIIEQLDEGKELTYSPTIGKFMTPMLAKGGDFTVDRNCLVDYKYDGIRAQFHIGPNKELTIFNRKGDDVTDKFLDIGFDIAEVCDDKGWILDGEIYPINEDGSPAEFKLMMSRIHGKDKSKIYRNSVTASIFDVLYYDEQSVFDWSYRLRNVLLNKIAPYNAKQTTINNQEEMLSFYNEAINDGYEGVIVKSLTSAYEFGKRSKAWMKYKPPLVDVDCLITGATFGSGKRAGLVGSFEIAITDGTELISIGSVGSGFSDEELKIMTHLFNKNGPNKLIIEVKGDMVTQNEQGEYGLRFPRFVKYRDDKVEPTNIKELKI